MTRDELHYQQWMKLSGGLDLTFQENPFYRQKYQLAGISRSDVHTLDDLALLPFTNKAELLDDQRNNPSYGSNLALPVAQYHRLHQTSGTTTGHRLRWLDTRQSWSWVLDCWELIYQAVGMHPDDRLFFPFSFGPFLGFWAGFEGATRLGLFVLPGGGMSSKARLEAIQTNSITFVLCTPTYALRMIDVAAEEGIDLASTSVRGLILAGEPGASIPSVRERIESAWGARVFDHSGMTEIGSLGIEFQDYRNKLFMLELHTIAEVIDPVTAEPVPEGSIGELVLTNLGRWGSPLIRYRTGDLVCWHNDLAPMGYPFRYMEGGIVGRADDMLWVKGNNVYPTAVEGVLREFEQICEFQIEASGSGASCLLKVIIEPFPEHQRDEGLTKRLAQEFQNRLSFRPHFEIVAPNSLPRFEMKARRFRRV